MIYQCHFIPIAVQSFYDQLAHRIAPSLDAVTQITTVQHEPLGCCLFHRDLSIASEWPALCVHHHLGGWFCNSGKIKLFAP